MWLSISITYLHFIAIFMLFAMLIIELSLLKKKMMKNAFALLKKADTYFVFFSVITIITGVLKVFYFGKGEDYYSSNPVFIIKIALFILVGLLSIFPTIQFLKLKNINEKTILIKYFKTIQLLLRIELFIFLIIPLLAVILARGIGV